MLPVAHTVFAARGLLDVVLPRYDLGTVRDCRLLQHNQNDTYRVCADHGWFILKVYQAQASYTPRGAHIAYEVDLLRYLHGRGVAVAVPIDARDGRCTIRLEAPEGDRLAVLFSDAPGGPVPASEWDDAFSRGFGAVVGSMHAAAADFRRRSAAPLRLDQAHLLRQPLRLARPFFAHRPDDWAYIRTLAQRLERRLDALARRGLSPGICHGDLVGRTNVHRGPSGVLTLYDFECCGPGWRAYDIGVFRWALAQLVSPARAKQLVAAFLDAYQERCPLTPADLEAITTFVAVRHFWFMGLRTGNAQHWGQGEVDDPALDELVAFWRAWEPSLAEPG